MVPEISDDGAQRMRVHNHLDGPIGTQDEETRRIAPDDAWLSPFQGWPLLANTFLAAPSFLWLGLKISFGLFLFLWFRATFPRYRYDQIMRLGWKALIPVTIVWMFVEMGMAAYKIGPWSH